MYAVECQLCKKVNYKETKIIKKDTPENITSRLFIITQSECYSEKNEIHTNYLSSITQKQFRNSVTNPCCFMPKSV